MSMFQPFLKLISNLVDLILFLCLNLIKAVLIEHSLDPPPFSMGWEGVNFKYFAQRRGI